MDELADQIAKFAWHLTHRSDSAENTVAAYDSDLRLFLKYLRAHVPAVAAWDDVRTSTVQHYMKFMRDEQRLKDTTVARRLFAVRSFFRYLRSQELVSSDPCAELSHSSPERRPPRILTGDEVERLLRQPANRPLSTRTPRSGDHGDAVRDRHARQPIDRFALGRCGPGLGHDPDRGGQRRTSATDEQPRQSGTAYLPGARPHAVLAGPQLLRAVRELERPSTVPARGVANHQALSAKGRDRRQRNRDYTASFFRPASTGRRRQFE